jgi:hypothetical protein
MDWFHFFFHSLNEILVIRSSFTACTVSSLTHSSIHFISSAMVSSHTHLCCATRRTQFDQCLKVSPFNEPW